MALETPGPLSFHVILCTALGCALIAVMVVLLLN
jgi:hypothetical protein